MKNQLLVISAVCLGLISVNAFAVGHSNHDKMMMDDDKTMITTMETPMLPTIVENAVATESVSTLVAAVQAAGLVDTLNSEGPFTVFAPTNSAFEKLPVGTVETLLQPENIEQLQSILTYHVLA
jgi:uncharacterized surface protein with fasciclin (FAS1) repeats